ncbi:MAG: potassium channel protein [Chloroflexi bacterium]|nr:potassium channel protein [Chloroflexota bacterium]MBT7080654.1 potassium channel protein [Chloroflexota bacterium]MBT7289939.1 potassium channel protein [Chloroflexota bacterium]
MDPRRRFSWVIYALLLIIVIGIAGYMIIEKWTFLDALYMTIITITTVGYGEVATLSSTGMIFSIVLIVCGVGVVFYAAGTLIQYIIEGNLGTMLERRRMNDKISKLKDHFIVCGFGRVGQEVAHVFHDEDIPFIVIDINEEAIAKAAQQGYLYIHGQSTSDEVLVEAGIEKAHGLVAATSVEADNVYIILSARGMQPNITIVARGLTDSSESKLKRAGADRTIYPYRLEGQRLAMLALRPNVVDFIETTMHNRKGAIGMEVTKVDEDSAVAGRTLKDAQGLCSKGSVVLIKRKNGSLVNKGSSVIQIGDELMVIGSIDEFRPLEEAA